MAVHFDKTVCKKNESVVMMDRLMRNCVSLFLIKNVFEIMANIN